MKYIYHHKLPLDFRNNLQLLVGSRLLKITGKQSNTFITESGNIAGSINGQTIHVYFQLTDNQFITLLINPESHETIIGEDVDYFSESSIYNECLPIPDYHSSFELYYDFFIESIEVYGKKRYGRYQGGYIEKGEFDFDILTESFILFKDKLGNHFSIWSNGNLSLRFEFSAKANPSGLFQKYIDEDELILKKHLSVSK